MVEIFSSRIIELTFHLPQTDVGIGFGKIFPQGLS